MPNLDGIHEFLGILLMQEGPESVPTVNSLENDQMTINGCDIVQDDVLMLNDIDRHVVHDGMTINDGDVMHGFLMLDSLHDNDPSITGHPLPLPLLAVLIIYARE